MSRILTRGVIAARHRSSDPLLAITGLSTWRRTSGLFQEPTLTTPATGSDPVGGWVSNIGVVMAQPDMSQRFTLDDGWVSSDNVDDLIGFVHTREPQYTAITRINLSSITGGGRILGINYTKVYIAGSANLSLLNEAVADDPSATSGTAVLDQTMTLRLVRESATLVKLYKDGVLISTLSGAQAADVEGYISLARNKYAGFAYADRILTSDELALVESELALTDP